MKRMFLFATACAGIAFTALQFVPTAAGRNPPVHPADRIEANLSLSPEATAVFQKACRNCHSNETEWPWYSRVAPVSWLIQKDVTHARAAMNLSEWHNTSGRTAGKAIGTLMAACAGVQSGRMPPKPYQMMHPEARVTPEEAKGFCEWTRAEVRELRTKSMRAAR